MVKKVTVGEKALKARSDNTKYDLLEVGEALTQDIGEQLTIAAKEGSKIIDEDEFCIVMVIASDPLIKGVRRHKYFVWPYLPKPRPQQVVFLYNKKTDSCKRLWSLPDAKVMAVISEMQVVSPRWELTKYWCDSFFNKTFHEDIRKQHNIKMESEAEYLDAHREELIKAGCQESQTLASDPFDFSKIMT